MNGAIFFIFATAPVESEGSLKFLISAPSGLFLMHFNEEYFLNQNTSTKGGFLQIPNVK